MTKDYTDSHQCHYIGSKDNPADYSSRGIDEANEKAKYHLLCGNQKHSEPFKTIKHFTGWSINVFRSVAFQLERTSWKLLRAVHLLGTK